MARQTLIVKWDDYNDNPKKYADLSNEMRVFIKTGVGLKRLDPIMREDIYALCSLIGIVKGLDDPNSVGKRVR
jgi:hypothetical protein